MMEEITLVIPAKNECENILPLFERIDAALSGADLSYRVIFIDDGSTDQSYTRLIALSQHYPVSIIHNDVSCGKAHSIIAGVRAATSTFVVVIDADLQYPPEAIPDMWALRSQFPLVVARRNDHNEGIIRAFFSRTYDYFFMRMLLGFRCDVQSGLKLFPRDVIECIDLSYVSGWTFDLSLLYTAREMGYTIGEVPIVFAARKAGASKVNLLGSIYTHALNSIRFTFNPPHVRKRA